ncbi:UDP-N-acetylmuramoyl-L-alanine--D-glutamate ligase [soil metagenome]
MVVVGLGVTGQAVTRALRRRGVEVTAVDDRPSDGVRAAMVAIDLELVEAPTADELRGILRGAVAMAPAPGLPEGHPAFTAAADAGVPVVSELDLAAAWDARPCLAVTGTDGKTTVTTLVTDMLVASGRRAVAVGNTEVPLVAAIDEPGTEVFVVEASSFRLAPVTRFRPRVGTWLNFAADHLDVHRSLGDYEAAKARIWADMTDRQVAVANADDAVVMAHATDLPRTTTFGLDPDREPDYRVVDGMLRTPTGEELVGTDDLFRSLPHDVANALAASATVLADDGSLAAGAASVGGSLDGVRRALRAFRGLPHRVALVGEADGVRYYDDSKATAPHATGAAVSGFASVVLIAGGRNKGLELKPLAALTDRLRAVVAIGEAAPEVEATFEGLRPVRVATSMDDAVALAADLARPGDAVLLSPACASFDWYRSYGERGDDFARAVTARLARTRGARLRGAPR